MGRIGPKKHPKDFSWGENDTHLVVDDENETCKAFDYLGNLLWERPALGRGVKGNNTLNIVGGDTPPGLYRLGQRWDDRPDPHSRACPPFTKERRSYGPITYDMVELENQENSRGRAGICLHGGGSACGWPGAWDDYQPLYPTFGCVRMHNADIINRVDPLWHKGIVYLSVFQGDW